MNATARRHVRRSSHVTSLLAAAALVGLALVGCAGEATVTGAGVDDPGPSPVDETTRGKTLDTLSADESALVALKRGAIDRGLEVGKVALADELNIVLEDMGVPTRYDASVQTTDGEVYVEPRAVGSCPFLETTTTTTGGLDCRTVSDRALMAAYTQLSSLRDRNPLDTSFDRNREENEFWYEQGMMTGLDNEATIALETLRSLDSCDQQPSPEQSAFDQGVQIGRQLYIERLNERLVETGTDMEYPDRIVQIEVCDADTTFLEPTRSNALTEIPTATGDNPLCEGYTAQNVDEANRLGEARARYEDGIRRGIEMEHSLAEEKIFRSVPCNVGDPLVLDIDGDGVDLVPVHQSHNAFDLFGTGTPLRTAWIQGDDALLALDRDDDGRIDSGRELFVNYDPELDGYVELEHGFALLARLDDNADGRIDARDAVFARLRLWQDRDGDGLSRATELSTLPQLGIAHIELTGIAPATGVDRQLTHQGRFGRTWSGMLATGHATGDVYDAWFQFGRLARR